jgi:hypothetical protein
VNAVEDLAARLPTDALRRLAALRLSRFDRARKRARRDASADEARALVIDRWRSDLCGLLNALTRGELAALAPGDAGVRSAELRMRLWERGAELERAGVQVAPGLQPRPVVLGGHLVLQAEPRGPFPPASAWPRALPPAAVPAPPVEEPDSLDELLSAADRAIGVRLGRRGRDKGAWGMRAAALLGVVERGWDEPDWRGDVELKTVPVAQDASGLWRILEDPAIAMAGERGALAKLQRTLWLARADVGDGDATIVSWYLLEYDAEIARLTHRYLHLRPKGPAGTDQRGLYLHRRFFADAGLLATLNGPPC